MKRSESEFLARRASLPRSRMPYVRAVPRRERELEKHGEKADEQATKVVQPTDFLGNSTISRDETKEKKHLDERLGLQAVLESDLQSRISGDKNSKDVSNQKTDGQDSDDSIRSFYDRLAARPRSGMSNYSDDSSHEVPYDSDFYDGDMPLHSKSKISHSNNAVRSVFSLPPRNFRTTVHDKEKRILEGLKQRFIEETYRQRPSGRHHSRDSTSPWIQPTNLVTHAGRGKEPASDMDDDQVSERIEELTQELAALKARLDPDFCTTTSNRKAGRNRQRELWTTIYRFDKKLYLGPPQWQHTDEGMRLIFSMPIRNLEAFVDRNPEILFVVYQNFTSRGSKHWDEIMDLEHLPHPTPVSESMVIVSAQLAASMKLLSSTYSDFQTVFPSFAFWEKEIEAPYLYLFHMFPRWEKNVSSLAEDAQAHIHALSNYLQDKFIPLYKTALNKFGQGKVSSQAMSFLIKPGDVVVDRQLVPSCFMAKSWPTFFCTRSSNKRDSTSRNLSEEATDPRQNQHSSAYQSESTSQPTSSTANAGHSSDETASVETYDVWMISGWRWVLADGRLSRQETILDVNIPVSSNSAELDITMLNWIPLRYASQKTKDLLAKRGQTFWLCKERHFVGYEYQADDANGLDFANERFMIDFNTYRLLHPPSKPTPKSFQSQKAAMEKRKIPGTDVTDDDYLTSLQSIPTDGQIYIFPSTVIGYNLRQKKWMDIEVDQIRDVQWNKSAFESLAIEDETKHLVRALVSKQLAAKKSTDLISGKGNGLLILLHGGPGTGKTFTAESVAELAEKPLYRVTCGDIGTKPEDVEKYLESVLRLGKIWGCVVLLDEADVFLEERSLTDLNRNALVSVFLRVLEYYDGILILTSNRVGTFDQAFKSRIQLALHYENLRLPQRRKIWRNFFNRLKELEESEVDYDSLYDHIDELAKEEMNGRQIRNAITTARQLAQFDGRKFGYGQLQHAIKVASKFEVYLKGVKGVTDDELARDEGIR